MQKLLFYAVATQETGRSSDTSILIGKELYSILDYNHNYNNQEKKMYPSCTCLMVNSFHSHYDIVPHCSALFKTSWMNVSHSPMWVKVKYEHEHQWEKLYFVSWRIFLWLGRKKRYIQYICLNSLSSTTIYSWSFAKNRHAQLWVLTMHCCFPPRWQQPIVTYWFQTKVWGCNSGRTCLSSAFT